MGFTYAARPILRVYFSTNLVDVKSDGYAPRSTLRILVFPVAAVQALS